jgi:DNA (cytosine-5)-methyltransferase 1
MPSRDTYVESKYPWDREFDLDRLAELTHKSHHPDFYTKAIFTKPNETEIPEPFANSDVAFKEAGSAFRFIDLFAGIGGFRIGAQSVLGTCVFSSEWDKYARRAYFMNFGQVPFGDITKFTESVESLERIPSHDVLCGGFPCQAFSISGKQAGFKDPRGTLFFEIYKIAKHHRPKVLFLENVKNFEKHDRGNTFKAVKHSLEEKMKEETNGEVFYRVSSAVLNASDFGASTKRERIYIVAVRNDLSENFMIWENWCELFRDLWKNSIQPKYLEEDIQGRKDGDTIEPWLLKKITIKRSDIKLSKKKTAYDSKPIRIGIIGKGGQGERIYSIKGHAITFSAYGGGAASKTGAYLINKKVRKLTPTECARAMGFEGMDVNTLDVPLIQRYKQFGNSVVVNVIKEIFKNIDSFWLK